MTIPKDPVMMLSVINTALRDHYDSFEALVDDNELDGAAITEKLAAIDYHYNKERNQFI